MKSQKLKSHVKDYYQDKSLNDEKMQRLMNMSNQLAEKDSPKVKISDDSWITTFVVQQKLALVASLMVVVVSFWGFSHFEQNRIFKDNFSQVVAQEIALNHRKQLNLDFNEIEYSNLNKLMQKLDFQIIKSNHINMAGLEVVGARYCSIQGNIAAQIRLRDENNKVFTLYQTKLTDMLKKNPENNIQSVGRVDVKQWQENGLFFGLAVSLDSTS